MRILQRASPVRHGPAIATVDETLRSVRASRVVPRTEALGQLAWIGAVASLDGAGEGAVGLAEQALAVVASDARVEPRRLIDWLLDIRLAIARREERA